MEKPVIGRREQNRLDAYLCIHRAAYRLSVIDKTSPTVEDIAAEAGVSPRTFFNYFKTKEEAILGFRQPRLTNEQRELLEGADFTGLFEAVVSVLYGVIKDTVVDPETYLERVAPFRDRPEHRVQVARVMVACESLVNDAVVNHYESREGQSSGELDSVTAARALCVFAASILRFTFSTYPDALSDRGPERIAQALEIFRGVTKETL